jgi:hypothetical protein
LEIVFSSKCSGGITIELGRAMAISTISTIDLFRNRKENMSCQDIFMYKCE